MARRAPAEGPASGDEKITLSERLVVALVCFCIAAVTAAFLALFGVGRLDLTRPESVRTVLFWSTVACSSAAVAGFVLGGEHMARALGFLWGTEITDKTRHACALALLLAGACVVIAYVFFR